MSQADVGIFKRLSDWRWEVPQSYKTGMRVPGVVYASEEMLPSIEHEQALDQVANVAFLPGILKYSLAMPDIHWGYGFPIGGVAAMRPSDGVVSPGGVGFDINCGVRLLRTNLTIKDVLPRIMELVDTLFRSIPSGVGARGKLKVNEKELNQLLTAGSRWAVERGLGEGEDIYLTEENGRLNGADPTLVSARAKERGEPQLGTLGSGNHFVEVQRVAEIYDVDKAAVMGVREKDQVLVLIHTGSRGLGHQVCTDYVKVFDASATKYHIDLPDRQLACAPIESDEGRKYLAAMAAAANFAWVNRQCIAHWVREAFNSVFGSPAGSTIAQIYDVAHNIAKMEEHTIDNKKMTACVHRKGATRAFPPGHRDIPEIYRSIGQPVLIPGDMGRYSFVAVGTETAMKETFGSTCHGAGRLQSRHQAKKAMLGRDLLDSLAKRGITVRVGNVASIAEEASYAYKDVADVVEVTHNAGISLKVFRSEPIGVVKG